MLKKLSAGNRVVFVFYLGVVSAIITVLLVYFQTVAEEEEQERAATVEEVASVAEANIAMAARDARRNHARAVAKRVPIEVE